MHRPLFALQILCLVVLTLLSHEGHTLIKPDSGLFEGSISHLSFFVKSHIKGTYLLGQELYIGICMIACLLLHLRLLFVRIRKHSQVVCRRLLHRFERGTFAGLLPVLHCVDQLHLL